MMELNNINKVITKEMMKLKGQIIIWPFVFLMQACGKRSSIFGTGINRTML